jgi:hypothetical protein
MPSSMTRITPRTVAIPIIVMSAAPRGHKALICITLGDGRSVLAVAAGLCSRKEM